MRTIFELADKIEGFTAVLKSITISTMGAENFEPAIQVDNLNLRMVKLNDITAALACTVMFSEHGDVECNFHTTQANEVCGLAVIAEYSIEEGGLSEMTVVALDKIGKALPEYKASKYSLALTHDYTL